MERTVKIVVTLELLALGTFIYASRRADSFLPEHGGSGDASVIADWGSVAGVSFYLLALLVATGVVIAWIRRPVGASFLDWLMRMPLRDGPQLIVALPIIGLALAILVVEIFPWADAF